MTVTCVVTESSVSNVTASVSNATLVIVGGAVESPPQATSVSSTVAARRRGVMWSLARELYVRWHRLDLQQLVVPELPEPAVTPAVRSAGHAEPAGRAGYWT